jgi:hypothetical protein
MKFLRPLCCYVDSTVVTVPSSPSHSVLINREEHIHVTPDLIEDLLRPKEPPCITSLSDFSTDLFADDSSTGSGSLSASGSTLKNVFQGNPKCSQELVSHLCHQHSNPSNTQKSSLDWGYPGHLSQDEYEVYVKFHNEASQRSEDFQRTILCFGTEESKEYALCRWLRARKFDLSKTINMVEEAMYYRAEAAKENFFPNGSRALGVEKSIYYTFYPEVFVGYTNKGFPLFITKAADASTNMLNCITSPKGIMNFHWYSMMHVLGGNLRRMALSDPNFQRFEACIIVDLERITVSTAIEALPILKGFILIDQLCFPEVSACFGLIAVLLLVLCHDFDIFENL